MTDAAKEPVNIAYANAMFASTLAQELLRVLVEEKVITAEKAAKIEARAKWVVDKAKDGPEGFAQYLDKGHAA